MAVQQPIDGESIGKMGVDRERLRYVTKLLASGEGLGLGTALLGTLLFFMNTREILGHWVSGWWRLLAALAWVAFLFGFLRIYSTDSISKYYERRFGSVQAARAPVSKWNALSCLAFLLALFVLIFFGRPIGHYLDPVASQLHMTISDPDRQISLWPLAYWAMLLCLSLRWHMSSIERQRAYFMLVGMIGLASIVSYAIWHPEAKQHDLWNLLNAGEFGLSLIALGLYDHITLVLLLPKRVVEDDDE